MTLLKRVLIILISTIWCFTYQAKGSDLRSRTVHLLNWVEDHSEDRISDCWTLLKRAEKNVYTSKDDKLKVKVLLSLSKFSLTRLNNLEKCHHYLEEIKKIASSRNKNPWYLAQYYNGRGVMFYHEQTNSKKALEEFRKAQSIIDRAGMPQDPMILNNYGLAFLSADQAEKALYLFKSAAIIAGRKTLEVSDRFTISNGLNIGVCYIYLGKVDDAAVQFEKVVDFTKRTIGKQDDFDALIYLGVFQEEQGDLENAQSNLEKARLMLNYSHSFNMKALLFSSLELICEKKGAISKAYENAKLARQYEDSLQGQKLSEQSFALDYKMETQKLRSEQLISKLKNDVERQNTKWRIIFLVGLMVSLVLIGFFIISRLNKAKELNHIRAENEMLEKERIRQQSEIDLLRKEEELISANVELNVRKNELSDLKNRLQSHLDKSHDPEFDDLRTFLKQVQHSEKKLDQMKYLDHVLNYSKSTFYANIRAAHSKLTDDELRLATLIRFNLSSEELADVFNISLSSLMTKRYRLRKKLGLHKEESLEQYILKY
jgi:Tfp pilus assembly protein PilF/DNA-binding CsgD family transcriptional regulator